MSLARKNSILSKTINADYSANGDTLFILNSGIVNISGILTATSGNFSSQTVNTIAGFDGSKNLVSLATATYPSLTELSYVKGVTSGLQTQLNSKAPTASPAFTGRVGIGAAANAIAYVHIDQTAPSSGGVTQVVRNTVTIPSTTTDYWTFLSAPTTQAASFTLSGMRHFVVDPQGFGAGSTVTNQFGYIVESSMTGATNNYGFYSNIASGTGRFNFYANGTAANYFAGNVGIGTSSPSAKLDVHGTIRCGAGSTDPGTGAVMYLVGSGFFQTVIAGAAFGVHTGGNDARTERFFIDGAGNSTFKGRLDITSGTTAGAQTHFYVRPESGALGRDSQITLGCTFSNGWGGGDTVARDAGAIRFGANGGSADPRDWSMRFLVADGPAGSDTPRECMRITAAGNVGIGAATATAYRLHVVANASATNNITTYLNNTGGTRSRLAFQDNAVTYAPDMGSVGNNITFDTVGVERLRVGSGGRVQFFANNEKFGIQLNNGSAGTGPFIGSAGADIFCISKAGGGESVRVDANGNVLVGQFTTTDPAGSNTNGIALSNDYISVSRSTFECLRLNLKAADGTIVALYQDSVLEGSISVAGNTVSYNAFCGSHWSQLIDNSKPEILRGTVLETLDETCEWIDGKSDRLVRVKISDIPKSKRVYGVFLGWDENYASTGDMYVAGLGAYYVRVKGIVQSGDLLESAGDGTAIAQNDDIVRSSTIGKVSSVNKITEYSDDSYLVACTLMCG